MNRIPKDKTQKTNKEVNFHTNFPVLKRGSGETNWQSTTDSYQEPKIQLLEMAKREPLDRECFYVLGTLGL